MRDTTKQCGIPNKCCFGKHLIDYDCGCSYGCNVCSFVFECSVCKTLYKAYPASDWKLINCSKFPNKVRFTTKRKAKNGIRNTSESKKLTTYKCNRCGGFHIGHKKEHNQYNFRKWLL
jgi:hypothetical protein